MSLSGQTLDHKYLILEPIGAGGMSLVYLALNIHNQTTVAVKLMKEKVTSSYLEDFLRFKREIEIISKFRYPGVIEAYDAGEYQNQPYLVTELLEGESLAELLQRAIGTSGIDEAVEMVTQIAQALQYVHQHGVIHRDLKPGNVFLLKGAPIRIKLLDFGIAHMIELGELKDEAEIVGTFGYMAPEASGILNRRLDERSDLYSLGVIFYRLLTGELPFQTTDLNRLLHSQAALTPPRPRVANSQIPLVLEEIILKMLRKDPDLRYQSAQGLLNDLDKYRQGDREFQVGSRDQKIKLSYQTRLVGREAELERLRNLVEQAVRGSGSLCFITGEPGIGKSRLVEEVRGYVLEHNGLFLRGRCLNHENKLPYQPFKDVLDEYIRAAQRFDKEVIVQETRRFKNILGDLGEILIQLNPRMEQMIGKPKPLIPLEPEQENQRFLMVLANFFCWLGNTQGLCLLFLDDLQWADEGSLNLLAELAAKNSTSNLLILGTYRDNEITSAHGLGRVRIQLSAKDAILEEIRLVNLKQDSIHQMVALLLGETGGNVDHLINFILERSEGNPLFVIHIIRELVENKTLFWNGNHWEMNLKKLRTTPVSGSMVSLILKRMTELTPKQNNLLRRASVMGREFELDLLSQIVKINQRTIVKLVDQMIAIQLLERSPERGRLIFAHDLIRDAFYQQLTIQERRQIHYEIAQVIEAAHKGDLEVRIFALAHHYLEAGELAGAECTLEYTLLAAERAGAYYANEEAIKYYQKGIEFLEREGKKGGPQWLKANGGMVEVYLTLGRNDEAIMIAAIMMPFMEKPLEQARIYHKIGNAYFKKGDWDQSIENLYKGLKLLEEKIPNTKLKRRFALVKELLIYISREVFRGLFLKPKRIISVEENKEKVFMLLTITYIAAFNVLNNATYMAMRILNIAETSLIPSKDLRMIYDSFAMGCMIVPLNKMALKYHTKASGIREDLGDEWGKAYSIRCLGITYLLKGMYAQSIEILQQSQSRFQKIGDLWELGMVYNGLGYGYQQLSNYQEAIECFNRYLEISRTMKNSYGVFAAWLEILFCSAEKGIFDGVEEQLNDLKDQTEKSKQWHECCCANIYLGFLELERENYDQAIKILNDAKKINEEYNLFKNYTVLLYSYLADAYLKKLVAQCTSSGVQVSRSELKKLSLLCKNAIKKTKPWPSHYGTALRATANYLALRHMNHQAEQYFLKSIEHTKTLNRRYELAKCYYEYGHFFNNINKQEQARNYWFLAYQIFTEIGAEAYRRKCSDLLDISEAKEATEKPAARDRLAFERRMDTVFTTSRDISSLLNLEELLEKIVERAMELVGAERGVLMLYPEKPDPDTRSRRLELIVNRKLGREEFEGKGFGASRSIIAKVESEKKPLLITDALADKDFKTQSSVVLLGIRSALAAPIMAKGALLGVIYLDNRLVSGLFTEEDLQVVSLIANQAGVSIENARYLKEVEKSRQEIAAWNQTLEQRVLERTEQLEAANRELKTYTSVAEELAVARERNRIARDVHDTLGHTLTVLVTLLEASRDICENNPEQIRGNLDDALKITRNGLNEVRRSVVGLVWEEGRYDNFIDSLEEMITHFQLSGLKVNFAVDERWPYLNRTYMDTIYRICQEALTNSIKHGQASEAHLFLRFDGKLIKLFIFDNGCGCKDFGKNPGFGLRGMRQRVESLRGRIVMGSDGAQGFNIHVEIPVEEEGEEQ